jgi:hypothetical protein
VIKKVHINMCPNTLYSPVSCSMVIKNDEIERAFEDVVLTYFNELHIISAEEAGREKCYMNHRWHSEDVSFPLYINPYIMYVGLHASIYVNLIIRAIMGVSVRWSCWLLHLFTRSL